MKTAPTLQTIALTDTSEQPWRNGGGSTRELLAWPAGAGAEGGRVGTGAAPDAWRVRVSVARIAHDGPFSAFPGVQRWFTVLAGAGVRLRWARGSVDLVQGSDPVHFDGGDAPGCAPLDGPTLDLNLMLRGSGGMQPVRAGEPWHAPGAAWRGVYARSALQRHGDAGVQPLAADTLAWAEADASPWRAERGDPAAPLEAWWLHLQGSSEGS